MIRRWRRARRPSLAELLAPYHVTALDTRAVTPHKRRLRSTA